MIRDFKVQRYDPVKSRGKAWKQAGLSVGAILLTALSTWVLSVEGAAIVESLLPQAWVVAALPVLHWLATFYLDRRKHNRD